MRTEKVKSNEKRPENKLGCAFCISFQYKIKRKFTFLGQIPNIFYLFQLPHSMKYIWYSFWGGRRNISFIHFIRITGGEGWKIMKYIWLMI